MNAKEMIIKQLQELGADGLCQPEETCGCGIADLSPCGCINEDCQAAKWIKPKSDDADYWDEYPDGYYKVME